MNTVSVLSTDLGRVQGVKRTTIYDDSYWSFEGIPFATPPLGELRFRAPRPAAPWKGIRDCSNAGNKPVQRNPATGQVEGSEDCLYLNVYAKTLNAEQPLPVMVWIYGGAFESGTGNRDKYGPDYFMQQEIILVTSNYRLSSLGFLSLSDPQLLVPGNAGFKDQILVLKWLKQNVANFNGDPKNVTVCGASAGGTCAHYLSASEEARGLFHKIILMSSSALNCFSNIPQAGAAYRLAKHHGFQGENIDREVLVYLQSLEVEKLVTYDLLDEEYQRNDFHLVFGPAVEPYVGEDCVVPRKPLEMLKTAWSNEIPMILGGTSFEGLHLYPVLKMNTSITALLRTDPERALPAEVRKSRNADERRQLAATIIRTHFGEREPGEHTRPEHLDLYSYKVFSHAMHRTALSRLAFASAPTYLYRFDFDSPDFNIRRKKLCGQDPIRGVAHAGDLSYLFLLPESSKFNPETSEYITIQRMIDMWTSFAKNSDPNCKQIEPTIWQPLQQGHPNLALNISHEVKMMETPEAAKFEAWNRLYTKEELY